MPKKRSLLITLFSIIISLLTVSSCDQLYAMYRPTAIIEVINNSKYSIIEMYCIKDGTSDSNSLISSPILPDKTKTFEQIDRAVTEVKIVFENNVSANYETDFENYDKLKLEIQ